MWRYDKAGKQSRLRWLFVLLLIAIGLVIGAMQWRQQQMAQTNTLQPTQGLPPVVSQTVSGRYLLHGTVTWARAVEQQARGDYNQPFSMLNTFNREQYDAWSTDFECPITNNTVPYATQISKLIFNCRPEFLPTATKFFNIFDLSNNHTGDQGGEVGLEETRRHLQAAGVQYFGTYDPADSKNVCEVLTLPVRIQKSDKSEEKAALPVAFCGWHYFNRPDVRAGELEVMDQYSKIMPVFAFAEMGAEYLPAALPAQVSLAHNIIDRGPEFLIANNPHWVQNTEVYKGKLIVYSTGNFMFDQLDAETNRSASIDVTLSVPYDDNVAQWLKIAPACSAFHDDCLAQAEKFGLSKVKLQLDYAVVGGQNGYRVTTHKADAAIQKAVELRMNWAETLQALRASQPAN